MRHIRNLVCDHTPHWLPGGVLLLLTAVMLAPLPADAWIDIDDMDQFYVVRPAGIAIVDGSFVMNASELQVNITNFGLIGSMPQTNTSWSDAPSAQWPAGSGVEYLWGAGLWVGGVMIGERLVSTGFALGGGIEMELRPNDDVEDVIYEATNGRISRPPGNETAGGTRIPEAGDDDDDDGEIDEETLNGYDDDEDGLIDEDFAQVGNQMMVCTMYDNTRLASELYADHTPLNIKVVQNSYSWENDDADDFVAFEFEITNIGVADIDDVYIGFFADSDIGARSQPGRADDDMSGSFDGMVLARDNSYVPISVGYMYDDDGDNTVADGYFGIVFLGHDIDPTGSRAPKSVKLRTYQNFSGQQSFDQGGDPTNDSERYELLSADSRDPNVNEGKENDYRFLVSAGPFSVLPPGEKLKFQAALVVGRGLIGLKKNCAEAALTWYGNYFNTDGRPETGTNGRETQICLGDYSGTPNPIYSFVADYMDTSCVTLPFLLSQPQISQTDLYFDSERNDYCIYVNMDNCFECGRQNGETCTPDNNLIDNWNCWNPEVPVSAKGGCTGVDTRENQVHWLVGMAPPAPGMRVWPTDNSVHVYWNNKSEVTKDVRLNEIDFESYRIWRADNWDRPFGSSFENGPQSDLWQLISEYDVVNEYIQTRELSNGTSVLDTLPLGANTGLEDIVYTPDCLSDPEYAGLYEAMEQVVFADSVGFYADLPQIVDRNNNILPEFSVLEPWKNVKPTVLDTFFLVIPRPATGPTTQEKVATDYYEYIDSSVHNGFIYFYSVTATDHALKIELDESVNIVGAGLAGDPGSSFTNTTPGSQAQTPEERESKGTNIYAYPNPATRDALAEFQELNPNADDPTGVRVCFANLPLARNTIKIFSLNGDLIQTVDHDGTTDYGEACWNLVSRNGQEVVSGIYLYVVQSDDGAFDDFIGKFIVIR